MAIKKRTQSAAALLKEVKLELRKERAAHTRTRTKLAKLDKQADTQDENKLLVETLKTELANERRAGTKLFKKIDELEHQLEKAANDDQISRAGHAEDRERMSKVIDDQGRKITDLHNEIKSLRGALEQEATSKADTAEVAQAEINKQAAEITDLKDAVGYLEQKLEAREADLAKVREDSRHMGDRFRQSQAGEASLLTAFERLGEGLTRGMK